ncbi:MarR family winged helix-turn-helix transcriptional regulator [Amycolatopsis viridis]|uniref:DNA-binding MarR family transcriptional regulator n=1 Tax=Amycolatopsis viridis TaxID=185678 RepID=A0ABX0SV35_9PSEU|nr:MarR family transcriptional regulator [Amycolatopsis viridis]NIH79792.1 DNA-binding MarR family transcriptional regulator [Amycolatopsis viridis]
MHETRPPTLLELPSYLAGHVARIGHRGLVAALAEHGLRLPHFAVLTGLSDFGPLAQHVLADRLGLNRSHLVGYLDLLAERGFVGRERDPQDRRRQRAALTAEGRELVRRLQDLARRSQEESLGVLSTSERRTLVELMRRVVVADDAAPPPA